MTRKAIFVAEETHHRLKLLAVMKKETFDELINSLITFHAEHTF